MSVSPARPPAQDAIEEQGQGWRIGVFDSGVGGLSVLRAVRARLPQASLVYVADSGYAPYGERDQAFITARCHHIAGFLRQREVDCIIVACNTATAIAVNSLRADLPDLPIIGVEPGVKPAVAHSPGKRVGVLATPGTLASERFQALVESHGQGAQLTLQACPGLAKEIATSAGPGRHRGAGLHPLPFCGRHLQPGPGPRRGHHRHGTCRGTPHRIRFA